MKICSYTMTVDTGFAPNPFHGWCTLVACTPNHMNANLKPGDWIAGYFTDTGNPQLVYCLQVDEVLDHDGYYRDQRFGAKRPKLRGSWFERCGDNFYHLGDDGQWVRKRGLYHQDNESFQQDTRHPLVYVGKTFAYFGENAYGRSKRLPRRLESVFKRGRGIKYTREGTDLVGEYLEWLRRMPLGVHGDPRDRERNLGQPQSCQK